MIPAPGNPEESFPFFSASPAADPSDWAVWPGSVPIHSSISYSWFVIPLYKHADYLNWVFMLRHLAEVSDAKLFTNSAFLESEL